MGADLGIMYDMAQLLELGSERPEMVTAGFSPYEILAVNDALLVDSGMTKRVVLGMNPSIFNQICDAAEGESPWDVTRHQVQLCFLKAHAETGFLHWRLIGNFVAP